MSLLFHNTITHPSYIPDVIGGTPWEKNSNASTGSLPSQPARTLTVASRVSSARTGFQAGRSAFCSMRAAARSDGQTSRRQSTTTLVSDQLISTTCGTRWKPCSPHSSLASRMSMPSSEPGSRPTATH